MIVEDLYISHPIFEVIQPLIVTLRLFGLFPISYKKKGSSYILKWSVVYGVYSYVLGIGLALWTAWSLISDMKKPPNLSFRMTDEKTRFVTCVDISIVVLIVTYGIITLHSKIRKLWNFMGLLNQADNIIQFKPQKCFKRASICFITTIMTFMFIIISYDILVWFSILNQMQKNPREFLKYYFSFYLLYSMMMMQQVLYCHIILVIKLQLSFLNMDLMKIRDKINATGDHFLQKFVCKTYLDRLSANNKRGRVGKQLQTASTICDQLDKSIELGRRLISYTAYHKNIFKAAEIANNSMEFCIPLIMLSCLLHLIVTPYFLLTKITRNTHLWYVVLQTAWISGHIGRVVMVVEPCQSCINEQRKTLSIISDLLTYEVDDIIKKEITKLAVQFNQMKLRFSSCGFFKINRSLLTSIAGAVTTYLVILFQFNGPKKNVE